MKIKLAFGINGMSGKKDGMVYCVRKDGGAVYARKYVKPDESVSTVKFSDVQRNLWNIHPSEEFKNDLRQYIEVFNRVHPRRLAALYRWNNIYMMILYEMQRRMQISLETLSRNQIYEQNLPCISVAAAVEYNLIPPVPGWESLIAQI